MENLKQFTNDTLQKVNMLESVMALKPTTVAGSLIKSKAIQMLSGNVNLGVITQLVNEMLCSSDILLKDLGNEKASIINENEVMFCTALSMERTNNRSIKGDLENSVLKTIDEHLTNEVDLTKYIRNGGLDREASVLGENALLSVVKATKSEINEGVVKNESYEIYHPISYIEESDEGVFFRVENSVFHITENNVELSVAPSKEFIGISEILENHSSYDINANSLVFESEMGIYAVKLGDKSIQKLSEGSLETVTNETLVNDTNDFIRKNGSKSIVNVIDSIIAVSERADKIDNMDNVRIINNNRYNESCIIVEHAGATFAGVLKSNRWLTSFNKFASISEAIGFVKSKTNVDLTEFYKDKLVVESEAAEAIIARKKELNELEEALTSRKNIIETKINLLESNSDEYVNFEKIWKQIKEELVKIQKELNGLDNVNEGSEKIEFKTEAELKKFVSKNRKIITNINGIKFGDTYPVLTISNKHASYYDVNKQDNTHLKSPFKLTVNGKINESATKAFKVIYDKKVGGEGTVIVKANDEKEALVNAKNVVATGSKFRDPKEVPLDQYTKPKKQGFTGR